LGAYRQKFDDAEEEKKKEEDKFHQKKRAAEREQEKLEKQIEIRETFKSIMIEDQEFDQAKTPHSVMQSKHHLPSLPLIYLTLIDEIDELQALNDLKISELVTTKLSVNKLMKRLAADEGSVKDCMKLVITIGDLQEKYITIAGNEYIKPIKNPQAFYSFMISLMPEIMIKLFFDSDTGSLMSSKINEANNITKSKLKQKRAKKSKGGPAGKAKKNIAAHISIENKVIIAKYVMLFPFMYTQIEDKSQVIFEPIALSKLVSIISSDKLIMGMMSSMLSCIKDHDILEDILMNYVKINASINPSALEYSLASISQLMHDSDHSVATLQTLTNEMIRISTILMPEEICFVVLDFVKNTCRKYKHKIHKAKSELTDETLKEIIDKAFLRTLNYMQELVHNIDSSHKQQGVNQAYEIVMELIAKSLSFVGHEITVYMPFVMTAVNMYNKILHRYQLSLSDVKATSSLSISSYIMQVLEKNDAYFTKKPKNGKINVDIYDPDVVELDEATLGNTKVVGDYFTSLMTELKHSLALYYNRGKNIAFPEFTLSIQTRLKELATTYATFEETIKLKNEKMVVKDTRNKIYASRKYKLYKLMDMITETANATYTVRNGYASSVNIDSHQLDRMIAY
jgi:hypothetical protein